MGSVLVGSRALIERALRWRKMLGGGLRQSGVLAAACLYALEHNVERLAQDHDARLLAEAARHRPAGCRRIRTWCSSSSSALRRANAARRRRHPDARRGGSTRLVTHLDVSADDVRRVVASVARHLA